jgi:beta-phosphoglucomutase-like phosphatase (HAD superfamily)
MDPFELMIFDTYGVVLTRSPRYLEETLAEEADATSRDLVDEERFWARMARRHRLSADEIAAVQERLAAKYCKNLDLWKALPGWASERRLVLLHGGPAGLLSRWQAAYGLDHFFAETVATTERGVTRAEPALYADLAAAVCLEPARCLLVDADRAPVEAARAAGMGAYRFGTVYGLRAVLADPALAFES